MIVDGIKAYRVMREGAWVWITQCPGCECYHSHDSRWTFNNPRRPTIYASYLCWYNRKTDPDYNPEAPSLVCHSFTTEGRIQFLNDCTHELAGQTVNLPDIDIPDDLLAQQPWYDEWKQQQLSDDALKLERSAAEGGSL